MKKIKKILIFCAVMIYFGIFIAEKARADAWWGEGYKSRKWVLKHGGTMIDYEIIGDKSSDKYKAVLYDANGKYVEVEFGKKAHFDDAKNGTYTVSVYEGGTDDQETYRGGKKKMSQSVVARPGSTVRLVFNLKNKSIASNATGGAVKKPVPKNAEIEEKRPEEADDEKNFEENNTNGENDNGSENDNANDEENNHNPPLVPGLSEEAANAMDTAKEQIMPLENNTRPDEKFKDELRELFVPIYSEYIAQNVNTFKDMKIIPPNL